ncbi:hypothetical protein ACFL5V_13505, partial [Fibrobacterota bacterium]
MYRLLTVLILLWLCVYGCSNANGPDIDPPEVHSIVPDTLSVTDRAVITFNEHIDTAALEIDVIQGAFSYHFDGPSKLVITGSSSYFNLDYFDVNSPVEFRLMNFRDTESNA